MLQYSETGELTSGVVGRILTSKTFHPRGIKVMLTDGTVIRVQHVTPPLGAITQNQQ